MIGVVGLRGMGPCASIVGALNEGIFVTYLRELLLPKTSPGTVIFMDRLRIHCNPVVVELIERAGCRLRLLPPYSPDLNPIEESWSKIKQLLRRAKARTIDALFEAIGNAMDAVHHTEAAGWMSHAGYCSPTGQPL